jgi:hypothetical protein
MIETKMDMDSTATFTYDGKEGPDLSALYTQKKKPAGKTVEAEAASASTEQASVGDQLSRVKTDMDDLVNALEMFFIDNNTYPLPLESRTIDQAGIKQGEGANARVIRLTAPVTYIEKIPTDPFNPDGKAYRYWSDGKTFVLVSDGPNRKPDYDESGYKGEALGDLTQFVFDPAQGEESQGDIVRIGP